MTDRELLALMSAVIAAGWLHYGDIHYLGNPETPASNRVVDAAVNLLDEVNRRSTVAK